MVDENRRPIKGTEEFISCDTLLLSVGLIPENGFLALVPVKTAEPIPKNLIFDVMTQINSVVVEAPVFLGDVIVKDVAGTGIDIVATRDMPKSI